MLWRAQVGDYGELSLNVNMEFLPVRAGFIRPDALRMIDTFGQTAELDSYLNDIAVAESIRPEGGGEYGVLPPRLSGPGSLCLDWEEKAPEFSPVCGYLMPDFLNSRISIYDEAGGYEGNLASCLASGWKHACWFYRAGGWEEKNAFRTHAPFYPRNDGERGRRVPGIFEAD